MRRRVLLCLTLIAMSACNGDKIVQPIASLKAPSNDISDATHSALGLASNPDFFFLPPMVKNPNGSPLWNAGAFNAALHPTVEICAYADAIKTESALNQAWIVALAATPPSMPSCGLIQTLAASASAGEEQYSANWKVPSSPTTFYRITVKVGTKTLGFADVETASNMSQLKNVATEDYIPLNDGRTLPIKFRIERFALCDNPLAGGCSSVSGDIAAAPVTVSTGTPDPTGISTVVGVTIPQQTTVTLPTPVTVTISSCPSLNPRVLDLPTFGDCTRVTTDPVLPRLVNPATVFICAVGVDASLFHGLSEAQEERVTLHRYDATGEQAGVVALPHAHACTPGQPGGVASIKPSLSGMFAKLAHGELKRAASEAVALLAPKPLYAAMFIDLGGGGFTEFFSDFQFALPAKMEIVEGTSGQTAPPGSTLSPTVKVTDLGGDPVAHAKVHFFTGNPAQAPGIIVETDAQGLATTPWTISSGSNSFPASGRGIAGPDVNGPRGSTGEGDYIVDPFQPMQSHFDPGFDGVSREVSVRTGSVTFTATGAVPGEIIVFNDLEMFDNFAMQDVNNQKLAHNLGSFTGTGPRAAATSYFIDGGHGSAYPECLKETARSQIGLAARAAWANGKDPSIPADVKLYILCLPATEISAGEISAFRQFVAEGGRIVFVGENTLAYGGNIPIQNKFLSDMGSSMVVTSDMIDCGPYQQHPVNAASHQVLTGMQYVLLACSSVISNFGPGDISLFSGVTGPTGIIGPPLAGVTHVGPPPVTFARAAAAPLPAAPWTPTGDTNGNPFAP